MNMNIKNKSNDYFLNLLENAKDIFYLFDAVRKRFDYVSQASTKLLGYTPEEMMEMKLETIVERVNRDDHMGVTAKTLEVLKTREFPKVYDEYIEQRFQRKDGDWVWLGLTRNFIAGKDGKVEAIIGTARDITEIKSLEQKLETSLNNYKSLYHNARVPLFRTRISDGKVLECNEALALLVGYQTREECLINHNAKFHYANSKRRDELIQVLKEKGKVDNFELKSQKINGEMFWLNVSAKINIEEDYIEGAIWDVTASKILTKVEYEILQLIVEGKSNKQIALEMKRSIRTVEEHRANIMKKMKADNVVDLTKKALNWGMWKE
jgi:PAS domain S-box-containing protein